MDATQHMLELLNSGFPDITSMDPLEARAAVDARVRPPDNLDDVHSAEDVTIISGGAELPLRVYTPHEPRETPAVVFAHGGGFLHGSIASHDGFCRRWARGTGATVVSVGYRLAPEHAAPAGRDDMVAAADWVAGSGLAEHGIVLAGDSSGGNLAAGAAIVLRDRGDSPVVGQVLIYPFLDPSMSTGSHRTRATGFFVTAELLAYYWRTLLGDAAGPHGPDVTPLGADDLSDLPPAIVITAGLDPLCDEGSLYAARLRNAGVEVLERRHPDQFHGFLTIPGYPPAQSAAAILWSDLRSGFAATASAQPHTEKPRTEKELA
ncbi:alpha/beta hydrolase [Microbacterium sp. YJN-G]|uniref:alpha/beta hydrolase n=1 Tax=Microbacterium sp. YJN-G TaxID=2763257 RepID=UPI001D0CB0B0|nr:alpha/beta hydrolase [Microbacterium sp. YJN-G]